MSVKVSPRVRSNTVVWMSVNVSPGLDQIRHFSRHRTLATMLIYRDEHDRAATQRTLADIVAATLTPLT